MEEFLEEFAWAFLINSNLGVKMSVSTGKPLIKEKVDKMKSIKMASKVRVGLLTQKIVWEYKPQKSYDEIRENMADVGNGMFKKTLVEGFGETLKEDTLITVQYAMILENDDDIYDSSYIAEEPFKFVLGRHLGILPSFERAVRTMRNQEKAEFIVPHLLSPENGRQLTEDERRNGYLVVEVIRVVDIVTKKERARLLNNINETLEKVEELREKGRSAFVGGFYRVAVDIYMEAVHMLRVVLAQTPADNKKRLELLMRMCLNAGITLNKLNHSYCAIEMMMRAVNILDAEEEVQVNNNLKGKILLHTSRTHRLQGHLSMAFVLLKSAEKCLGDVKDIKDEFKDLYHAYDHLLEAVSLYEPLCQTLDMTNVMDKHCYKRNDEFAVAFDLLVKTFMCSKAQKKIVYGVRDNGHLEMANEVVVKYKKVRIEVQKKCQTFCYILTKK